MITSPEIPLLGLKRKNEDPVIPLPDPDANIIVPVSPLNDRAGPVGPVLPCIP